MRQRWCSATAARWASSPATASWRCSARRWRWRTTLFAPAWRRLGIQEEATRLAAEVHDRDGVDLQLRVGLNSGQVIAGEIGSGRSGYTAIGEQVGMAQRMESVAPPGGVMLSASTARLVEGAAALGEPELVRIKGADEPVRGPSAVGHGRTASRRRACRVESGRSAVGDVRRSRACWTGRSTATARWSAWSGRLASARAVWCARFRRWQLPWCRGVHRLLRVAHQPDSLPCRGAAAARGHRRRGS